MPEVIGAGVRKLFRLVVKFTSHSDLRHRVTVSDIDLIFSLSI